MRKIHINVIYLTFYLIHKKYRSDSMPDNIRRGVPSKFTYCGKRLREHQETYLRNIFILYNQTDSTI